MTKGQVDVNDLEIDPTLVGSAMRDELVVMYNKLSYWTEQHSEWDSKKKQIENMLEEAKDKAKAIRATEAMAKALKAKIQDSYIRDFWGVPIEIVDTETGELKQITCSSLNSEFIVASQRETQTRHKMNLCNTALDIGRTAVSWDKQEYAKQGGTQ